MLGRAVAATLPRSAPGVGLGLGLAALRVAHAIAHGAWLGGALDLRPCSAWGPRAAERAVPVGER